MNRKARRILQHVSRRMRRQNLRKLARLRKAYRDGRLSEGQYRGILRRLTNEAEARRQPTSTAEE